MPRISSPKFIVGILVIALVALCILFAPFFSVFILIIVLGTLFNPVNTRLRKIYGKIGGALVTLLLIVLCITAILGFIILQVGGEAHTILSGLQSGAIVPDDVIAGAQEKLSALFPSTQIDLLASFQGALKWVLSQTGNIVQSMATIVLHLFLALFGLFFWFKDSEKLHSEIFHLIPLSREDAVAILEHLKKAMHSLIQGTLAIALLQGISAGVGFIIFGVPNALLWASITAVCALVPTLGTSIVFIPMVFYFALSGNTVAAVGLALWGAAAVGLLDNVLGPRLMSRGSNLHPFFTLLAVLGGVQLFGPLGIFAGPLIVSLFSAVCKTYVSSHTETAS